ncbi:MAG: bifunctional adenosylcobinamide kinase/adenosylcobinamide-phosphate guanylyltransferase [Sneathiella sp.]|uniref:bifunctional adenosylcobinamide kinase/adenosylcobinamide-phosphate guanylyltransferase n=1 Tax=Sneathiella sp. TaxID=1964365 RepID=UPI0030018175
MREITSPELTLILGGARSGKSRFAEDLVIQTALPRIYLATAQAYDEEMTSRISNHRSERGENWVTVEEPLNLLQALQEYSSVTNIVLVDCLTLWVSNLMGEGYSVEKAIDQLIDGSHDFRGSIVFVSNEVGQGIVPENAMAREFRDHAGRLHQRLAEKANSVYFVTAGLARKLK